MNPRQLVRRPSTQHRSVKILEVTDTGRKTFRSMDALFATPPPEPHDAPREDLPALVRIAERVAGTAQTSDAPESSDQPRHRVLRR